MDAAGDGLAGQLALVAVLVLVNAVFAGSEIALVSLREGQLERLRDESRAGRALAHLAEVPNRYLSTIQVAITLAGFLASATAAVTLAAPLEPRLGVFGGAARPVAIFLVTAVLTFVTLVFGELAPKRLAMQWSQRWALVVARPLDWLATVMTPVVWILSGATDLVVRLLGGDPTREGEQVTHEEIRDLVATGGLYTGHQRQVISGALEVADRTLRQVVTPRPDVLAIAHDCPADEARRQLAASGHTRAPVVTHDLDDAEGYVSILGLVDQSGTAGDHQEEAVVLPESARVLDALRTLQQRRQQMALVVSEHGAIEGLVTVEDLVEEIVGEIYDEHDRDLLDVRRHPDGSVDVPGRFPLHDLQDLGVDTPDSNETTLNGLFLELAGRLPRVGDVVSLPRHEVEVLATRRRTVGRARIRPVAGPTGVRTGDEHRGRPDEGTEPDSSEDGRS